MLYLLAYLAGAVTLPVIRFFVDWLWLRRTLAHIDLTRRPDLYERHD